MCELAALTHTTGCRQPPSVRDRGRPKRNPVAESRTRKKKKISRIRRATLRAAIRNAPRGKTREARRRDRRGAITVDARRPPLKAACIRFHAKLARQVQPFGHLFVLTTEAPVQWLGRDAVDGAGLPPALQWLRGASQSRSRSEPRGADEKDAAGRRKPQRAG